MSDEGLVSAFQAVDAEANSPVDAIYSRPITLAIGGGTTFPGEQKADLFMALAREAQKRRIHLNSINVGTPSSRRSTTTTSTPSSSSGETSGGSFPVILLVGALVLGFLFFGKKG